LKRFNEGPERTRSVSSESLLCELSSVSDPVVLLSSSSSTWLVTYEVA
jgi:hypothetical protein